MKAFIIILALSLVFIAGCAKEFVCYDGTVQQFASKCPTIPAPYIDQQAAIRAMDNYGNAIAQAKGDIYTRVNTYSQNTTWYAGVLFTNIKTQNVKQASFRIDGKTAAVTCQTGCDYVAFNK